MRFVVDVEAVGYPQLASVPDRALAFQLLDRSFELRLRDDTLGDEPVPLHEHDAGSCEVFVSGVETALALLTLELIHDALAVAEFVGRIRQRWADSGLDRLDERRPCCATVRRLVGFGEFGDLVGEVDCMVCGRHRREPFLLFYAEFA